MTEKVSKLEGLGDVIATITKLFGIDRLADRLARLVGKEDCGCTRRREKLNKLVPFKKIKNAGKGIN